MRFSTAGLSLVLALLAGCASLGPSSEPTPAPAKGDVTFADDVTRSAKIVNNGAHTTGTTEFQKFLWFISPYRPDIQQGNFISSEQLGQLKVGMTRDQVKFVMGTPLVADVFHANRWDFPFYMLRGSGELTTSRVIVFFDNDKVAKIDSGELPSERDYLNRIAGPQKDYSKGLVLE